MVDPEAQIYEFSERINRILCDSYFTKNMISLLYVAGLLAIATAAPLSPSELNEYETKLRKYQNMTNIDENAFQEIWRKGLNKRKISSCRNIHVRIHIKL